MFSKSVGYLKLIRVSNWFKNIFVFVPLVFSKSLFGRDYFLAVVAAFFIFSFASSLVYVINVSVSNRLILTTIFISLFLAIMKRRVEIVANPNSSAHRSVLKQYSVQFLDQIAAYRSTDVGQSFFICLKRNLYHLFMKAF
ncbi:MAG: hypothetical protein M1495_09100 [Bacteroidetes bacterium]|nr:hypothetical protein [Bacteroidota bacterium]